VRAVVVGGGLAGLAAALELVDAGHEVTLYEARPTLGGAVQTLPEREGDPSPPPDNGQHIALGCFTEYLSFLERIGESGSYSRRPLLLPVFAENGRRADVKPSLAALLSYGHVPLRDRLRIPLVTARCRRARPQTRETFGALLRRLGASDVAVERFWDVFMRPALNLPSDEVDADAGLFTVRTALLGPRANSDLVLPTRPLGWMHGDAAGRALERAGANLELGARVDELDDLAADAIVVATPPEESARLLGEPQPRLEHSPIVSVHLLFERRLLEPPLAALLASDAHWVFDRGALTGDQPPRGQYLTVVSSGVPELMEIRGRELVDRIAAQVTERLGASELLWSRVSREPHATVALRPGNSALRPAAQTARPNVTRAGAWVATGWPATMESAVRSGRAAARLLSDVTTRVAA
jgi:squalene-associated FAD-dependent desaturase